jgi:hypothetical protein
VSADPVRDSFEFGEPILIRLTVRNIGAVPLAIGPDCALRPDFWFDAYFRGALDQGVTGAAVERLDQRFLLLPGQTTSTVVRVDQDALYSVFTGAPSLDLTMNMMIATNPVEVQQNGENRSARSGPCGYRAQLTRLVERLPMPISTPDERAKFADRMSQGDGGVSIRTLAAMAAYVPVLQNNSTPDNDAAVNDFLQRIHKASLTDVPAVRAWAKSMVFFTSSEDSRDAIVTEMLHDADWRTRLLAGMVAPVGRRQEVFSAMAGDSDAIVREFGRAGVKGLAAAAATQPSNTDSGAATAPAAP